MRATTVQTMTKPKTIRVLVADPSPASLEGMTSFLETQGETAVIGTALNCIELLKKAKAARPDLIITNISTGDAEGAECVSQLRALLPKTRIIVFTVFEFLMTRVLFFEAGADSVIQGDYLPSRLTFEIRRLFRDE
jgi:DNA-binding NarL/FixJ family response regulator